MDKDTQKNTTLIEFPLEFTIKVFAVLENKSKEDLKQELQDHLLERIDNLTIRSINENLSKKANYVCYSMKFYVENQSDLDDIYYKLKEHKHVKMLL